MVPRHDRAFTVALNDDAAKVPGTRYGVVFVAHTWLQLNRTTSRILSDSKRLRALGIRLSYWGPDVSRNRVSVTLVHYTPAQASQMTSLYGSPWIYIRHTRGTIKIVGGEGATNFSRGVSPVVNPDTRTSDTSPFYGADAYWFNHPDPPSNGYDCTSGFAVNTGGGDTGMIVAGHCYVNGVGHDTYTNSAEHYLMGIIDSQLYPAQGLDAMEIVPSNGSGTSFAGSIWGDGSYVYTVVGRVFPQAGADVFTSGASSGTNDDVLISSVNNDVCEYNDNPDECDDITNVTFMNKEGSLVCQPGDSGGAVGERDNTEGQINAAGIIIAFVATDGIPDYGNCWMQQIGAIDSALGDTILTGG
jgi:hypothetical protein